MISFQDYSKQKLFMFSVFIFINLIRDRKQTGSFQLLKTEASQGFCSPLARAPACCFSRKLLCFRFSRSRKAIKRAMREVRNIVHYSKYYQNDFRYLAKIPRKEELVRNSLALPVVFFNFLQGNLSKFSKFVKFVLPII